MWNNQDSIELNYAMNYFQDVSSLQARQFEDIIIGRISVIEKQSIYFFGTLVFLLITFYFCLWKRSYLDLSEEAIRINKYLMIIPLRLMRNNHNIKVHMMKYLRVNVNNIVLLQHITQNHHQLMIYIFILFCIFAIFKFLKKSHQHY